MPQNVSREIAGPAVNRSRRMLVSCAEGNGGRGVMMIVAAPKEMLFSEFDKDRSTGQGYIRSPSQQASPPASGTGMAVWTLDLGLCPLP